MAVMSDLPVPSSQSGRSPLLTYREASNPIEAPMRLAKAAVSQHVDHLRAEVRSSAPERQPRRPHNPTYPAAPLTRL